MKRQPGRKLQHIWCSTLKQNEQTLIPRVRQAVEKHRLSVMKWSLDPKDKRPLYAMQPASMRTAGKKLKIEFDIHM